MQPCIDKLLGTNQNGAVDYNFCITSKLFLFSFDCVDDMFCNTAILQQTNELILDVSPRLCTIVKLSIATGCRGIEIFGVLKNVMNYNEKREREEVSYF